MSPLSYCITHVIQLLQSNLAAEGIAMQNTALFTQLLGLTPPWRVTELTPGKSNGQKVEKALIQSAKYLAKCMTTEKNVHGDI